MIKILCEKCETIFIAKSTEDVTCPTCNRKLILKEHLFKGHFIGYELMSEPLKKFEFSKHINNVNLKQNKPINNLVKNIVEVTKKIKSDAIKNLKNYNPVKKFSVHNYVGIIFFILGITLIGYNVSWFFNKDPLDIANADSDIFESINNYLEFDLPQLKLEEPLRSDSFLSLNDTREMNKYKESFSSSEHEMLRAPFNVAPSSHYGYRTDPIYGNKSFHAGVDLPRPYKSKIRAALSGKVKFSGKKSGYGNLIIIEHKKGYETVYGHNSKNLVSEGEVVKQNQIIGLVGDTGRSTGPHLHFELRKNGQYLNPEKYLNFKKRL